jgi:TolB-like protein/Flp pilus assembly protein TadD
MASKASTFLSELKRRKVYHVAAAYLALGVGVVFGIPDLFSAFDLPTSAARLVIILIAAGFPIALALAWAFEVRTEVMDQGAEAVEISRERAERGTRKSIVVLPFDNLSPDPGDAYFSDGLTEEIISDLSCCGLLRVISRSSAMVLKGTQKNVKTIGEELGVGFVLEGSVRKAGDQLRITAQLIDAASDEHLWTEKYDGVLGDVFSIQESVSRSIVEALELRLSPEEEIRLADRPIEDFQAYECYLRARHDIGRLTKESLEQAIRTLRQGLELFPDSPILNATLGNAYCLSFDTGYQSEASYLDRAQELAAKTLSLDPRSPHGMKLLGHLEQARGSLAEACRHMMAAHEAEPNDAEIMLWAAFFLSSFAGRFEIADDLYQRLGELDPLNPLLYHLSGAHHLMKGDPVEALRLARKAGEMNPEMPHSRMVSGLSLAAVGKAAEGIRELEALEGSPEPFWLAGYARFLRYAISGSPDEALAALDDQTRAFAWNDPELAFWTAGPLSLIERYDLAVEWVQRALDRGCINYPYLAETGPFLESLRKDSRFQKLLAALKPAWESFDV